MDWDRRILSLIFDKLHFFDKLSCRLVCTRWSGLIVQETRSLDLSETAMDEGRYFYKHLIPYKNFGGSIGHSTLAFAARVFRNLQHLDISGQGYGVWSYDPRIIFTQGLAPLKSLNLVSLAAMGEFPFGVSSSTLRDLSTLTTLERLELSVPEKFSLQSFLQPLTQLRHLALANSLSGLDLRCFERLESLRLVNVALDSLPQRITELELEKCTWEDNSIFANLVTLKSVTVSDGTAHRFPFHLFPALDTVVYKGCLEADVCLAMSKLPLSHLTLGGQDLKDTFTFKSGLAYSLRFFALHVPAKTLMCVKDAIVGSDIPLIEYVCTDTECLTNPTDIDFTGFAHLQRVSFIGRASLSVVESLATCPEIRSVENVSIVADYRLDYDTQDFDRKWHLCRTLHTMDLNVDDVVQLLGNLLGRGRLQPYFPENLVVSECSKRRVLLRVK